MPHFEKREYDERMARTKASMADKGIDVLLSTNPANMCYLTGYDAWSFYVHQLVIVSLDQEEAIWVGRGMDANAARVTTYLSDGNIYGYPDDYVQSTVKHPMDYVSDLLKERGWDQKALATEKDTYYFTAACQESLQRNLPDATFKDASTLVNWVKVIKSPAEIAYMDRAARIIEKTMAVGQEMVRPGVRQCDAAAAIAQAQISGTAEFGGDYTGLITMLPSGVGSSTPHMTWSDDPFKSGEATVLELGGCHRRYHCPMARTMHLGAPPQKIADTAKVVVEGLNLALEAVKPGATCESVEAVWSAHIAKHGVVKDSRIGYSTGLNYPPDWGESTLSLRPGDKTLLQENMTIHMIMGIWLDDWGVEISECFQVVAGGARKFCDYPQDLLVIE